MIESEDRGQQFMAGRGQAPAPRAGDFGDDFAKVKAVEESRGGGAVATNSAGVCGLRKQMTAQVAVAEATEEVFPPHDSGEEAKVVLAGGVETAVTSAVVTQGLGEGPETLSGGRRVLGDSESVEVALIGGKGDLGIAREVGDPFGHGEPTKDKATCSFPPTSYLESVGTVDNGLDTQYAPMFVVHFHPVLLDGVFDPQTGPPFLVVGEDLSLKVPVEFFPEEGQDILGAEAHRGVPGQLFIQELEGGRVVEHDVGGELGLFGDPVVCFSLEEVGHQGVGSASERGQDARPVLLGEAVGEGLGASRVVDTEESVVSLLEGDAPLLQFPGEPVVPVETHLNGEGKPALEAQVHEAQLAVDEVEVETQALASRVDEARAPLAIDHLETLAGFHCGKHADQSLGDAVAGGDFAGLLLLADGTGQVNVGSPGFPSELLRVHLHPLGGLLDEALEILDQKPLLVHKVFHGPCPTERQVSFEQYPVKTGNDAPNLAGVLSQESFHGALLSFKDINTTIT
jgi:hypothetical protein